MKGCGSGPSVSEIAASASPAARVGGGAFFTFGPEAAVVFLVGAGDPGSGMMSACSCSGFPRRSRGRPLLSSLFCDSVFVPVFFAGVAGGDCDVEPCVEAGPDAGGAEPWVVDWLESGDPGFFNTGLSSSWLGAELGAEVEGWLDGGGELWLGDWLEPDDPGLFNTGRSSSFADDLNVGFFEADAEREVALSTLHVPCARQSPFSVSGVETVNSPTGVPVRNPSYTVPGSSAIGTGVAR